MVMWAFSVTVWTVVDGSADDPGQTGQRDDAYVRLLAILAGHAE
jgi:hypothetical protein